MAAPSYVFTIAKVADMLGEDRALLEDLALGMEPEDGRLFIVDIDEYTSVTAFTPFGVEYLKQLLANFKAQLPRVLKVNLPRSSPNAYSTPASPLSRRLALNTSSSCWPTSKLNFPAS